MNPSSSSSQSRKPASIDKSHVLGLLQNLRRRIGDNPTRVQLWETANQIALNGLPTLAPILPMLLSLKGHPYTLDRHFPFEPFFGTFLPKKILLKTGRQVSKTCLISQDNRVSLANGYPVPGHELEVGDEVVSFDQFRSVTSRVVRKINSGKKDILRIRTRLGSVVDIATTHPLRTLFGWKRGEELKMGDRVASMRIGGRFGRAKLTDRVLLTAYMIGDGCFGLAGNWNFTATPGPQLDEFIRLASRNEQQGVEAKPKEGSSAYCVRLHADNAIRRWASEDGLANKGSAEKFLPAWVFELNRNATAAFVARLWSTDGWLTTTDHGTPAIGYCTVSYRLAYDLRALLSKFGIPSSVHQRPATYRDDESGEIVECADAYIIRIETRDGWRAFMETFSVPGKPPVSLPTTEESSNRHTVPIEVSEIIAEIAGERRGKSGASLHQHGLRKKPKYALTYGKLRRYVEFFREHSPDHPKLGLLEDLLSGDIVWDEIITIEPLGKQNCWDVEVATHHNYVLNGLLSHNSTCLSAQGVVSSNCISHFNTLYVTPLYDQVRRLSSNYVRGFIEQSPFRRLWTDYTTSSNVLQRSFKNYSTMYFSYAFLDAERTRGINADRLVCDEVQNLNKEFLPILEETLSGSEFWGLQQFAGTPKTMDNTIQELWDESSQAEWMVPCLKCRKENYPALGMDLDAMIGPWHDGIGHNNPDEKGFGVPAVICANSECRSPVYPDLGRWVHGYPERIASFAGYHVPQIILPMHYENKDKWATLLAKREGRYGTGPNVFYNEVCGESYDTSARLVSIADLKRAACLRLPNGDPHENKLEHALQVMYDYDERILAVDWGGGGMRAGKPTVSWTVFVVMGRRGDGHIDVLYAYKSYTPHDSDREASIAANLLNTFKCHFFAHDFTGAGRQRENAIVHAGYPYERIIPVWMVPTMSQKIMKFVGESANNARAVYRLDKPRSLALTCSQIRHGGIRFFAYDHKDATEPGVLHDFLGLVEDKIDSRLGRDVYTIMREGTRPDDFAQAVNIGACTFWERYGWPDLSPTIQFRIEEDLLNLLSPKNPDWN